MVIEIIIPFNFTLIIDVELRYSIQYPNTYVIICNLSVIKKDILFMFRKSITNNHLQV